MSPRNLYQTKVTVVRAGMPLEVQVEADAYGDIVAIHRTTTVLTDNENSAARCFVLNLIYPRQGWDKRGENLLRIAREHPGT